jgi:hypothetical protein
VTETERDNLEAAKKEAEDSVRKGRGKSRARSSLPPNLDRRRQIRPSRFREGKRGGADAKSHAAAIRVK